MKRRAFITLLGGAAAAWPLAARAQQAKIYRIGYFNPGSISLKADASTRAFFDALRELGWIEGKNVAFEFRFAENSVTQIQVVEGRIASKSGAACFQRLLSSDS